MYFEVALSFIVWKVCCALSSASVWLTYTCDWAYELCNLMNEIISEKQTKPFYEKDGEREREQISAICIEKPALWAERRDKNKEREKKQRKSVLSEEHKEQLSTLRATSMLKTCVSQSNKTTATTNSNNKNAISINQNHYETWFVTFLQNERKIVSIFFVILPD